MNRAMTISYLSQTARLIALVIAKPRSTRSLADLTDTGVQTTRYRLQTLAEEGLVEAYVERPDGEVGRMPVMYRWIGGRPAKGAE